MTVLAVPLQQENSSTDRGWWLVLLCWLVLSLAWSVPHLSTLAAYTSSTDDTMRLVQVRTLLDGSGWYGLHQPRLDPPHGLDSHWSRLIDLPIAALILLGRPVFGPQGAELFAMIAWPALVYLAMMVSFVLIGLRLVPAAGPLPMIAAAIACLPVLGYFQPLAIDHHNVQMALVMLLLTAAVWSSARLSAAILGGFCGALVPAVGIESLHIFVGIELIVLGLAVFGGSTERRAARFWFLAQGIAIVPVYLINTPPDWWMRTGCDALQLNMAAALCGGSLALATLLHNGRSWAVPWLAGLSGGIGAGALALGLALDPACVAGPNARVAPEAIALWMRYVEEAAPWPDLWATRPAQAGYFLVYPLLALISGLLLAFRRQLDLPLAMLLAAMLIATAVMFTQVRGFTYAAIMGAVVIAVAACRLFPGLGLAPVKRIAFSALLPVLAIYAVVFALNTFMPSPFQLAEAAEAAKNADVDGATPPSTDELCAARGAFEPLKSQPKGLVLNHIDLGPALLLNTNHSVVMGPYHRADRGIVTGFTLMAMPAKDAQAALLAANIDYVAECLKLNDPINRKEQPEPFRDAALGKIKLDWLEALPVDPAFPQLRFWRVRR